MSAIRAFGYDWPATGYQGGNMHARKTRQDYIWFTGIDLDDNDLPPVCPVCGNYCDELQTGLFCPVCNVTYDDRAEIKRVADDLAAAPFWGN